VFLKTVSFAGREAQGLGQWWILYSKDFAYTSFNP